MNEQLQTALSELLDKANNGIDTGTSFLQAQLPDVIQQLLVWKAVLSVITSLVAVAVFIVWVSIFLKLLPKAKKKEAEWEEKNHWIKRGDAYGTLALGAVATGAFVLIFIVNFVSLDWLQIWLAPKIYLIEYAASLAK